MNYRFSLALLCLFGSSLFAATHPFSLNPENPHYFLFRGKPTVLITSGEHYGAVLNLDFDYVKYLDALKREGLNATRTWSGAYCEPTEAFSIASNTLAPLKDRFIAPWRRSTEPGYANGGNKFDLSQWDPAYFKRLKDFVSQAGKRGIIVELNLFCPFYEEGMWRLSPMNAANNVNQVGSLPRSSVYTLDKSGPLLAVQEAMVRKLVTELKGCDNVYYEICNEPYFGGVTIEWQRHIADIIAETELGLGVRHLISQNIANDKAEVRNPHPQVSIFNFHYATPPETVGMNYALNKVIGDNETGFRGTNDTPYRMEGWDFIVAGGGLFNNLDYSFTTRHEDGSYVFPASQPGGGTTALRHQLGFLSRTMHRLDFVHMRPDNTVAKAKLPDGATLRVLSKPGRDYLVYLRMGTGVAKDSVDRKTHCEKGELSVGVELPAGKFSAEWLDTKAGRTLEAIEFVHSGGAHPFPVPGFQDDIALLVRAR
jgi:hypothetical protein